ncbi:hypothetical protein [Luteimonas sp. MC1572]|uniref:hypothetical protein n=1 Tax=Luteimonas sp. MC1572 TaxID=2799325 RepID=UPI0018F0F600|nr:hypothetical protein [Luteimonas sp. MC1572]MBJ6982664.1 hypothetical protein [Luteimonas sp. MC1572]QQO03907.1 hypothetical protein JGR64_03855 [Luteimonas sp. MC1572]
MSAIPKFPPQIHHDTPPRLSVPTAARFLRLPAVEQWNMLREQKYPKRAPQVFKRQFYGVARQGIRRMLDDGMAGLIQARAAAESIPEAPRREHTLRVLESFASSGHMARQLRIAINRQYQFDVNGLELRLSPDLFAYEGDEQRFIYFNLKAEQYDPEAAKMTLEIAHWLLEQVGVKIAPRQIEFVDLFTGVLYKISRRRSRTIKLLSDNAKLIERMWPAIEP